MRYIIVIIFCTLIASSFGQNITAYEKKAYSLTIQFLRKLGVDEATLKESKQMGDLEKLLLAGTFLEKLNTERGFMLMLEYEREMKEAAKLKTAVDFQRDKEKKAEAERKRQLEIAKQNQRQLQAELERKEKEKIERYSNSDYVRIKNTINEDFNLWLKKGEFEKTDDYQKRLSSFSSNAFDSICYNTLISAFAAKSGFASKLLEYNADTERFGIEFNFNNTFLKDSIDIPINNASDFKKDFKNFGIYVDDENWRFFDNNLTPYKFAFYNIDKKQGVLFFVKNKDLKDISISTSDLSMNKSNINLKFDFNEYFYNIVIYKIKDGNTINSFAWDCLLNQKFQKALQVLERGISLVDRNDASYPYLLGNLAHAYLFNNQFEKAHKIYLENLALKLNDKTWKEAILEDFIDFKKKGIKSVQMDKIKEELLKL